jgi:hypothetical protein
VRSDAFIVPEKDEAVTKEFDTLRIVEKFKDRREVNYLIAAASARHRESSKGI